MNHATDNLAAANTDPTIDLEQAMAQPDSQFATPQDVVSSRLSADLKRRILVAWKQDVEAKLVEEDEGGPVREVNSGLIQQIDAQLLKLEDTP